jgi:hypothetical protein
MNISATTYGLGCTARDYDRRCRMTRSQARQLLIEYNKWRRGDETSKMCMANMNTYHIGEAIDVAIAALKPKRKEKK